MPIRPARPDDLDELMRLCAEHAAFERLAPPEPQAAQGLADALWGPRPRAWCLVLEDQDQLWGYSSFSLEFATWTGRDFVHLDCLYLRPTHRGGGMGRQMMEEVARFAAGLGVTEMQWQTPDWNTEAIAFYERLGATARTKVRFTWSVAQDDGQLGLHDRGAGDVIAAHRRSEGGIVRRGQPGHGEVEGQ